MAAALPIIEAIVALASTTYGVVNTVDQNKAADAARAQAAAAAKNQALDQQQQAEAAKNTALDTQVQTAQSNNVSLADQIKAKIAAQQGQAPGMSDSFWSGDTASQYPGFAGLVSDVTGQNQNQPTTTA